MIVVTGGAGFIGSNIIADLEAAGKGKVAVVDWFGTGEKWRNVAKRRTFFHNGVFHTLKEAVEFYADRDTNPEKWYPRNDDGTVRKFDDLPSRYHANINVEPPFDRRIGDRPALTERDVDDIVAFLQTLNDGHRGDNQ